MKLIASISCALTLAACANNGDDTTGGNSEVREAYMGVGHA